MFDLQVMPLECGQLFLIAVIGQSEILFLQIGHRITVLVRDDDLNELEDDVDLVAERFLQPDGVLIGEMGLGLGGV
jgi:hypothetical protein